MGWPGRGLSLAEFLTLDWKTRRARFCELADIDQLIFLDHHVEPLEILMMTYPPTEALPERYQARIFHFPEHNDRSNEP